MPPEKGRTFVSQSISFPPELLARAKDRSERLGLPFSTYVQKCIERDLIARDPIVFAERDPSSDLAPVVSQEIVLGRPATDAPKAKMGFTRKKRLWCAQQHVIGRKTQHPTDDGRI